MNWSNVFLIFQREVRDQLRDRRMLFMIFVLPVLLYPLMGMVFFQLGQFVQETPTKVRVFGRENLPEAPAPRLILDGRFHKDWFEGDEQRAGLLALQFADVPAEPAALSPEERIRRLAESEIDAGKIHAALYFPPDFGRRLDDYRRNLAAGTPVDEKAPGPRVYHNSAKRASAITSQRLDRVLSNWRARIATQNREAAKVPDVVPFELVRSDIADERMKQAALWSMVFPFLMLIWSLTGAFYPAVDLCAGEKERGTLETLLVSPAERGEIVCGKLLTIMLFSCVTVVFNLLAVGATGWFLISKFEKLLVGMGPPPLLAFVWLFIAVIPVSALFSALCLALAAFARSTREGQYYLMPLFLITLPLVILPMQPSFDLNFGNSLIPVTGIVLLLRAAIQGDYGDALRYFLPVTAVTAVCCLLAIRWAIDQFNKESVLFREGERLDLGLWLKHIVRDRQQTPSPAAAFACVATILTITFFMRLAVAGKPGEIDSGSILRDTAILLLVGVFTPAALMTIFLARDFRQTLSLRRPKWLDIGAALLLAVAWHPLAMTLAEWVNRLYPVSEQNLAMLDELFKADKGPSIWVKLLVMALLPAVCEEIAFRGFILAGFRHLGRKRLAIFLSAFVFGVVHGWLQQSIVATVTGCVLGYVVVQTGSILPAMLIHFVNNALVVGLAEFDFKQIASHPVGGWFVGDAQPGSFLYQWPVVAAAALAVVLLWRYFHNLQYERSGEEALEEAIQRGTSGAPA